MKNKDSWFFYFAIVVQWFGYILRKRFIPNIVVVRKNSWKWRFQNCDGEMVGKQKEILNNNILIRQFNTTIKNTHIHPTCQKLQTPIAVFFVQNILRIVSGSLNIMQSFSVTFLEIDLVLCFDLFKFIYLTVSYWRDKMEKRACFFNNLSPMLHINRTSSYS